MRAGDEPSPSLKPSGVGTDGHLMTIIDPLPTIAEPGVDEGPSSWLEARLDLLLAQELNADLEFARWVAERAGFSTAGRAVVESDVDMNVVDTDGRIPPDGHGETDVRVGMTSSDGSRDVVLIEDKVRAPFQPKQAERYERRAAATGARTLLIAPAAYLAKAPSPAAGFDGSVSIEEMAERIEGAGGRGGDRDARRSAWTARRLRELLHRRTAESHGPTVEFTEWCVAWFDQHAAHVVPQRSSLHTANQGWLYFEELGALVYKVQGIVAETEAMVDVYLEDGLDHEARCTAGAPGPIEGFSYAVDTVGNQLLRYRCAKLLPSEGVPTSAADRAALEDALSACVRAADWLRD